MPENAAISSGVQIGVEATAGTGVAANRLLNYMAIDPSPSVDFNRLRPVGQSVASAITPGRDSTEFSLSGQGSYSELIYPFCGCLMNTTPVVSDTTAQTWTFAPAARTEDAIKTYTVEKGNATRAGKFTYGLFTGIELTFNRTNGVTVGGSGIGQQWQDNVTMTASPTALPDLPILPTHINVFVDDTHAARGTTQFMRDFNAVWRTSDRFGSIWPLNSSLPSFGSHVETEPVVQMELTIAYDAQGASLLSAARLGATKFVRIFANAPITYGLAGAINVQYALRIDMAGKVSAIGGFDETDGVITQNFTLDAVYDAGWAAFQRILLTNRQATL